MTVKKWKQMKKMITTKMRRDCKSCDMPFICRVSVCVSACVCACVRRCMHACVCVHAYLCMCVCVASSARLCIGHSLNHDYMWGRRGGGQNDVFPFQCISQCTAPLVRRVHFADARTHACTDGGDRWTNGEMHAHWRERKNNNL